MTSRCGTWMAVSSQSIRTRSGPWQAPARRPRLPEKNQKSYIYAYTCAEHLSENLIANLSWAYEKVESDFELGSGFS